MPSRELVNMALVAAVQAKNYGFEETAKSLRLIAIEALSDGLDEMFVAHQGIYLDTLGRSDIANGRIT